MGQSPKIASLQEKDTEFRKYLDTLEKELDGKAADAAQKLQSTITDFYKDNHYDDAKAFVSGRNIDFLHEAEFSLDNLKKVIDSVSGAVFGGAAAPKGADVNKDAVANADKELGKEVGAIANLELYIAGKVFEVMSDVVLSFGTGASLTYTSDTKTESLGFGMQMFASVAASSYQAHGFFEKQYISQYLFMYDVRFSLEQAQTEVTIGLVQAYQGQLAVFEDLLTKLADKLDEGKISLDAYASQSDKLQEYIDKFAAKVKELKILEAAR